MIWFRSANSHTGPQLHRGIRGRTDGSLRLRANLLKKPLALGGAFTGEYTPKRYQIVELALQCFRARRAPAKGLHFFLVLQLFKLRVVLL
jgi:hypothetical protein